MAFLVYRKDKFQSRRFFNFQPPWPLIVVSKTNKMVSQILRRLIPFLFVIAFFEHASGQQDSLLTDSLPEVEVRALRIRTKFSESPLSLSVLDSDRIRPGHNLLTMAEFLPAIPGVIIQNDANFAQDLRISIRGFGARAGFGIRGIRILSDGFPETSPDGQGQVDQIDPTNLDRLEVLRGSSAGLYGNAAGGVIQLFTQSPEKTGIEARFATGAFGFRQYRLQGTLNRPGSKWYGAISNVQSKGYREQSNMLSTNAILKYEGHLKRDSTFSFLVLANFTDSPRADDPGGLTLAQVEQNPRMAHPLNVQYQAGESVRHGRVGFRMRKEIRSTQHISAQIWTLWRDFENRLPFRSGGQAAFQRSAGGSALSWEGHSSNTEKWRWTLGTETDFQQDRRTRHDNQDGIRGNLNLAQDEVFSSVGIFGVLQHRLDSKTSISGGSRGDWILARVRDKFTGDGDQSGNRQFQRLSPWGAISRRITTGIHVFANVSTNFEVPTLNELSNNPEGTGGFSESLLPQRTRAWEYGWKGRHKHNLSWELVFFQSKTLDEINPYELPDQPGRTYYRNAGVTMRRGIETALDFQPARKIRIWANYSVSQFRFEDFQAGSTTLDGKLLPGLPANQGQVSVRYSLSKRWMTQAGARFTGSMFADQGNLVRVPPGTWISWRTSWEGKRLSAFAVADNLANSQPYNNIRINAGGNRFFEPGQGRSFSIGLTLKVE